MQNTSIAVISLGGTISCVPDADSSGVVPALGASELVDTLLQDGVTASVTTKTWSTRDSSEITFNELIDLAEEVRRQYAAGAHGVVITQGTDTIEETAYTLDLLLGNEFPVVVTGAMRDASRPGADGNANLEAALRIAPRPELAELGTVVVFNDEIHGARWVRKTHTARLQSFQSPGLGPLGWVTENQPHFAFKPFWRPESPLPARRTADRVMLLISQMDDDPAVLDFIADRGYSGAIIAGMGGGHVDGRFATALGSLSEKIPVVFTSRAGAGEVLQNTYSSPGAEIDLINRGLIPAGSLDGLKARILLTLLIRSGSTNADVRTAFAEHGGYAHLQLVRQGG